MEFSTNQEDIYEKLVNPKSKYGKAVQVKYELTRPRKKQKKKNEKFEIVPPEQAAAPHGPADTEAEQQQEEEEDVYCVPPDEEEDSSGEEMELEDESAEPPPPPPRSDSLLPEPETAAPTPTPSITSAATVTSGDTDSVSGDSLYAPCNWRQQNYESWTPNFVPKVRDNLPPPTQPPPKPPSQSSPKPPSKTSKSVPAAAAAQLDCQQRDDNVARREASYETWTPALPPPPADPRPPTQQPPQPPPAVQPSQSSQPPVYAVSKKQFLSTPKQITGLRKVGQPTPFTACKGQEPELRKPTRPAPAPPTQPPPPGPAPAVAQVPPALAPAVGQVPPGPAPAAAEVPPDTAQVAAHALAVALGPAPPLAQVLAQVQPPPTDTEIRLSPIKDSLPSMAPSLVPTLAPTMGPASESGDPERLYEPCNWRRQMKDECEELYGAMGEVMLPPPPSPPPLGGSVSFARAPLRKSKSILKEKKTVEGEEKKKKVRMLFPEDTVTPI